MTNKPMLSVELRQALADFIEYSVPGPRSDDAMWYADKQALRALLDKPDTPYTPKGEWSFEYIDGGDIVIRNGEDWTLIKRGDGPIYEQFLYRFCEEQLNKPAVQHQGEPVAWVECSPAWLKAGGDCATAPRICVGREGISHLHPAHSNAEQPAPVAVVMPERKTKADYSGYIEQFQSEAAGLYNSALDDVARLNGVKP